MYLNVSWKVTVQTLPVVPPLGSAALYEVYLVRCVYVIVRMWILVYVRLERDREVD
jgi:hypothetical protein